MGDNQKIRVFDDYDRSECAIHGFLFFGKVPGRQYVMKI